MNLVLNVVFIYNITNNNLGIGEVGQITTIDELKTVIKNGKDYFKMPYMLSVKRDVQIFDKDVSDNDKSKISSFSKANIHPISVGTEHINMIVTNELMYPQDVRAILHQKYKGTLDFDSNNKWNEKEPVYFSGVTENTKYGLCNSKTGTPSQYTLRSVNCRHLNSKDIVVDEHLNQIWPKNTKKIPVALTQLLARTKEIIH